MIASEPQKQPRRVLQFTGFIRVSDLGFSRPAGVLCYTGLRPGFSARHSGEAVDRACGEPKNCYARTVIVAHVCEASEEGIRPGTRISGLHVIQLCSFVTIRQIALERYSVIQNYFTDFPEISMDFNSDRLQSCPCHDRNMRSIVRNSATSDFISSACLR
jgi:hypothetical protein